jgi:DNA polymerase-2
MDSYGLDAVSREVLGEGKTIHGQNRAEEILESYHNDRERFVEYNRNDARLVLDVLDRLHLLDLTVERSRLTGLPPDRVAGSIAAFDFLYLGELHRRGVVAPSVGAAVGEGASPNLGGHVFEPEIGLYRNVLVFDFKSLYPSLIRTFQIDPLGYLPDPGPGDEPIVAPNGAAFRRRPGILTGILDRLFPRREEAKARGDKVASHAIKILMNSFYGVLGTPACRFYRPELASAITSFGREILLWSKARIESTYGLRVLYGDTDSLFVLAGEEDPERAVERGRKLASELDRDLARHLRASWRVESRLELELEKLFRQLHLPSMRHGGGGARKRYAGLVAEGGEERVVFVGMEVVRSDWTELAKRVQRELYGRLFRGEEVAGYLEQVVRNLRRGRLDDLLTYRKALRKSLDQYTATTPPHVAAARKLGRRPGRRISYLVTRGGPEPAEKLESPIDYEHYVQKQIRPVAEPILELLHLDFDHVIGDQVQLELF